MTTNIMGQLALLRAMRETMEGMVATKTTSFHRWEEENSELLKSLRSTAIMVGYLEAEIRAAGIQAYRETGNKRPFPGVEVGVFEVLSYEDADALLWAQTHQVALSLDRRVFEALARGPVGTQMKFLVKSEEPHAQIAKDIGVVLSKDT